VTTRSIAFFASARSGLGHLQRIGIIAGALRDRGFAGEVSLFCNADASGLSKRALRRFNRVVVTDRDSMAAAARATGPTLAVSDMMVVPGLAGVGQRKALILRETPPDRIGKLALDAHETWDRIIVPNPPDHWMPRLCPGFSNAATAVGWITRQAPCRDISGKRGGVLLATGGGGTAETRAQLYPVLGRIICAAQRRVGFRVRQALGPRAAGDALPEADEIVDPGAHLDRLFQTAGVVISTAGYNSVLELACTDTPTLLVAIPRSFDDQQARVRRWGPVLGHGLMPGREAEAAEWLADQVTRPKRRAPVDLGPDGAVQAAEILAGMA
jgi:hypothetical protein